MDTYKQVIPTANRPRNNKKYSFDHITSQGFMTAFPIGIREVTPNMELKMSVESFCRLNPVLKPTFGRARVNNRAFFVPMRVLMPRFNEFIQSEPIYSLKDNNYGLQTSTPVIGNDVMLRSLYTNSTPGTAADYELSYLDTANVQQYIKLTSVGKILYQLFTCLGYKINLNMNDTQVYSALPLLAYAKVMLDWYFPNQYINNSLVSGILPYFQSDSLTAMSIPFSVVSSIALLALCTYDDSLLIDAWDRPTAPNNGAESLYSVPDITLPTGLAHGSNTIGSAGSDNNNSNNTPVSHFNYGSSSPYTQSSSVNSFTQYQHDVLKALTDYTTRHRLSGVRAVDRYFAEYGINLSSEIMKRSVMIGNDTFNIAFGDVMAHSDTYDSGNDTGAVLGDYSGKGVGYGSKLFHYNIGQEFGYLIVINTIIPEVGYYQGVNRINKHTSILDFWHADFDGLGVQAVAADEVLVKEDYNSLYSIPAVHSKVFGFVPRYAEYKTAPSLMTGLFQYPNASFDLKAFNFMRDLSVIFGGTNAIGHNFNFVVGSDEQQYNRIFYNQGKPGDVVQNFLMIHHFECDQDDEGAPLYDTYDFKEVERAVEVHTQASKVN